MRRSVTFSPSRLHGSLLLASVALIGVGGCAARNIGPELKQGVAEPEAFPSALRDGVQGHYRIGPLDKLDIKVFREPDLTSTGVTVDGDGQIRLPLLGEVTAAGKTAAELSMELERLYGPKYLTDPEIVVTVASSVTQKVTVQGEVKSAGIYPLTGPTTLLDTLSLAGGETEIASLREVVVLRTVHGQRVGAIFNAEAIRRGEAPDPAIYGTDVVIVGLSDARKLYRDLLTTVPFVTLLRPY